jgi:hypothetical protein
MTDLFRATGLDRVRSLDDALRVVERLRGRPLSVHEADLGAGLSGLWLGCPEGDRIIVNSREALSPRHRDHIVAHELMHVVEAAVAPECEQDGARLDGYDDATERRVERLAGELMIAIESSGCGAARLIAVERYR